MLQNIAPHIYDNVYCLKTPAANDYLLLWRQGQFLLQRQTDGTVLIPRLQELQDQPGLDKIIAASNSEINYLFQLDGSSYYCLDIADNDPVSSEKAAAAEPQVSDNAAGRLPASGSADHTAGSFVWLTGRQYRWAEPQTVVFVCSVAEQLNRWYNNNRYCGRCGGVMRHYETERAQICTQCGRLVYPTIMPVIITAITDGNRLLLTKGRNQLSNHYALVSGFVEIGEDLENCVRREIAEEVGLQVKNIRYYASQPWPFSDTLLMGFFAELDGSPQVTLQEEELAEAVWLEREDIPEQPLLISLTAEMITVFRNGQPQDERAQKY